MGFTLVDIRMIQITDFKQKPASYPNRYPISDLKKKSNV